MKSTLANFAVGLALLLGIAVCILAVRARTGSDKASWTYYRYMPDKSVRSNEIHLGSDHQHVTLDIGWGHVEPFNGQLVWGYHVNADQSGGRPQFHVHHEPYEGFTRWVAENFETKRSTPLFWESSTRTKEENGDDSCWLHVSIKHWLLALVLFVPPLWKGNRIRRAYLAGRRAARAATETYDVPAI